MSIKKSAAIRAIEKIRGGPLTFGRMLESIRRANEISQVDMAKKLKISKAYLCDIEKERRQVSLIKAMEFAKILGHSDIQFASKVMEDQAREAGLQIKIILKAA